MATIASECTAEGPGLTGKWTAQKVTARFMITARGQAGERKQARDAAEHEVPEQERPWVKRYDQTG